MNYITIDQAISNQTSHANHYAYHKLNGWHDFGTRENEQSLLESILDQEIVNGNVIQVWNGDWEKDYSINCKRARVERAMIVPMIIDCVKVEYQTVDDIKKKNRQNEKELVKQWIKDQIGHSLCLNNKKWGYVVSLYRTGQDLTAEIVSKLMK